MNTGGNQRIALFLYNKKKSIGGMETHAEYFIRYFNEHELLHCIVYRDEINVCSINKNYKYSSTSELFDYLEVNKINVLFFNDGHWVDKFRSMKDKFPDRIMIMRSGGNEFMKAPMQDMYLDIVQRRKEWANAINCIDYIIANSEYSVHRMLSIGIKKEKILLVRGGVDTKKCRQYGDNKEILHDDICKRYNIDSTNSLIGIVSRFEKFKGIDQVIKVLSKHQELSWHLVLAGTGNEETNILYQLRKYFNPEKYTYLGPLDNCEALYVISALDYLINFSLEYERESGSDTYIHTETMGRSMLEAICCRTPIIASDVGGTSELFKENYNIGYLLNDIDEFEKKLEALLLEKIDVRLSNVETYDWEYIFQNIYIPLMNIKRNK